MKFLEKSRTSLSATEEVKRLHEESVEKTTKNIESS